MSPIAREVVGRTRHKATLSPGVVTRDIRGNVAPNGQYLTPVGIEYPGMAGIDLGRIQTPFSFSGVPWNLDRRLSPGGCIGPCEGTPQPLSPFPFEGIDPRTQSLLAPVPVPSRILSFYPFGPSDVLAWPPADPASIGIVPLEPLISACKILPAGVVLSSNLPSPQNVGASVVFTGLATGGTGPYEYRFEGRAVGSRTWVLAQDVQPPLHLDVEHGDGSRAGAMSSAFWRAARRSTAAFEAISSTVGFVLAIGAPTGVTLSRTFPRRRTSERAWCSRDWRREVPVRTNTSSGEGGGRRVVLAGAGLSAL